mmetsp:Transcript_52378/g.164520  ORF Transcript_52378/g.164520 Transcript_52378/m.164520 type:complete len:248 (+) Transcript_52378:534-1277(+)
MASVAKEPAPHSLPPPRGTGVQRPLRPRCFPPPPSLLNSKPSSASFSTSVAVSTNAPAPSPNSTHVVRSDQSTHLDRQSAPMTRADVAAPVRMYCAAVARANTKPEHAAVRSKATAPRAPSSAATAGALPKRSSGVEVARMTKSTSSADTLASSKACRAAAAAKDARLSSGFMTCRLLMPVLWEIHSSVVSKISERSSLETTVAGAADPVPAMLMPRRPGGVAGLPAVPWHATVRSRTAAPLPTHGR